MNKDISFVEVSAIIVVILLLTRLPMKRSERPTVSVYIGVIILFFINGIITPSSLQLSPFGFCLVIAKVNTKKHKCFFVVSKKLFFTHIHKNCDKQIFMKKPKNANSNFLGFGVWGCKTLPYGTNLFVQYVRHSKNILSKEGGSKKI